MWIKENKKIILQETKQLALDFGSWKQNLRVIIIRINHSNEISHRPFKRKLLIIYDTSFSPSEIQILNSDQITTNLLIPILHKTHLSGLVGFLRLWSSLTSHDIAYTLQHNTYDMTSYNVITNCLHCAHNAYMSAVADIWQESQSHYVTSPLKLERSFKFAFVFSLTPKDHDQSNLQGSA